MLERALKQPFDVMLIDLRMPFLGGVEVIAGVRAEPGPNQKAVAIAFSADGQLDEYASLGFDEFLPKPFTVGMLLAKVVASRSARRAAARARVLGACQVDLNGADADSLGQITTAYLKSRVLSRIA